MIKNNKDIFTEYTYSRYFICISLQLNIYEEKFYNILLVKKKLMINSRIIIIIKFSVQFSSERNVFHRNYILGHRLTYLTAPFYENQCDPSFYFKILQIITRYRLFFVSVIIK